MIRRNCRQHTFTCQNPGRLKVRILNFNLVAARQMRSANCRKSTLLHRFLNQVSLGTVIQCHPQVKFLRNTNCRQNIIRAMRMCFERNLLLENRNPRLQSKIRGKSFPTVFLVLLVGNRLHQFLPEHTRNCHTGRRHIVVAAVKRLWIFTESNLHGSRFFHNHILDTASCGLHKNKLTANHVGAARSDHNGGNARFGSAVKGRVHRVDSVNRAKPRRYRIGSLIAVIPLNALLVLLNPDVAVSLNQPGQNHTALCIQHRVSLRRRAGRSNISNTAVSDSDTAVFITKVICHRQNRSIYNPKHKTPPTQALDFGGLGQYVPLFC